MYAVTVDYPNLPRGEEVQIDGLGYLKNGSTTEVSDDQAEVFRAMHSTQKSHFDKDGTLVTETTKGPTVLQAFQKDEYVTVEVVKDKEEKEEEKTEEQPPPPVSGADSAKAQGGPTVTDNTKKKDGGSR